MTFAAKTEVPVARTRAEIEAPLLKHEASSIGFTLEVDRARVFFTVSSWAVRFDLPLPTVADADAALRKSQWEKVAKGKIEAWSDQTARVRWRALLLCIKAKLVSVESGVESFEQAFLPHIIEPGTGGKTVGEREIPKLRDLRKLLPPGTRPLLEAGGSDHP